MGKTEDIVTIIIFNLFFIAFFIAIIIFIVQYKLKKKEHQTMLHQQQEQHQQEILSTQIEIQRQTMQHIGREIHDNIGQKLTLASLYTQQLAYENKAPQINGNIENISAIINQSLSELRELSKSLTDDTINDSSITKLLNNECNKINDLKICKVNFSSNSDMVNLDYKTKSVLLRITQEFLQNSIKHSKCKNINVSLVTDNKQLELSLLDDGKGFNVNDKSNGIGLQNIKKRTEILAGKYTLNSTSAGTQLVIEILI